jgi:hypothetical protein
VEERTLGLAVLRAFQHAKDIPAGLLTASYLRPALSAGQSMAFAERLRSRGPSARPGEVESLAGLDGIAGYELTSVVLTI